MRTKEEIRKRLEEQKKELDYQNRLLGGPFPVTTPTTYKLENEIDALYWVLGVKKG